jgi:hypothetical protein
MANSDVKKWTMRLELGLRIYVCCMLCIYGVGKIMGGQFYQPGHLPKTVADKTLAQLNGFELAWAFFGHSGSYIVFIGLSQIIGALLLLVERTKLLGVAVLIPILLNIIVVDICFGVSVGALLSAIVYCSLLLAVLFLNRAKVALLLGTLLQRPYGSKGTQAIKILVAMGIALSLFLVQQVLLHRLG